MENIRWERIAAIVICAAAGGTALYLIYRFALPLLLPFLVAWVLSLAVRPMAERLSARLHISKKICASVLLTLLLISVVVLCCLLIVRLTAELQRLLERLLAENGSFSAWLKGPLDLFDTLTSRIGFLRRIGAGERFASFREQINQMIADMISGLLQSLSASIPRFLGRFLGALPHLLLLTAVTVISGFYFCTDGEHITKALSAHLPARLQGELPKWRARAKRLSWRYLRAYLWLLLLTFVQLLLGFLILGVDYAFLISLAVALVDLLPVLGVGTVLVPWAVVMLLQKNFFLGFGLLILYLAVTVVRQILEPRLVGKSLGLHPLLSLFASWVGWQLLGITGMILGPLVALAAKTLLAQMKQT